MIMKIIMLMILMMGSLTILTLGVDFLLGFDFSQAIDDWIRPFHLLSIPGIIILIMYPLLILLQPIFYRIQKKKQE